MNWISRFIQKELQRKQPDTPASGTSKFLEWNLLDPPRSYAVTIGRQASDAYHQERIVIRTSMSFRDKFTKVERDYTPLYKAHYGEYKDGHYDVADYWSAGIEGVPDYDALSPTGARLKWRCSITGKWTPLAQWMCDTLDEAFDSIEKETTEQKPRKYWVGP